MSTNNIVWKRPDGGISVTHLATETESTKEHAEMLKERGDIPKDWELVAEDIDLSTADRAFREAWAWETTDPVIDINIDKAVELTKDRLRQERAPKLAELDLEFMRALESNNKKVIDDIKAQKQTLRDITELATPKLSLDNLKDLKVE